MNALASGSRVNRIGEDAAGYAISENLRAQVSSTNQAKRNAQMAQTLMQSAEGGLNEQGNILIRLRELAVYAASDTVGDGERKFLNTEFQQLQEEFDRIASSTRFGHRAVLAGSGEHFEFQVGAFPGGDNLIEFDLDADTRGSNMDIDGLDILSKKRALSTLEKVDKANYKLAGVRSTFGAFQARLQHAMDHLDVQAQYIEEARSQIADADIAQQVSELAASRVLQQAAVSVLAQANTTPMSALRLIDPGM